MPRAPNPGRWDYAAGASALAVLAFAYLVYPRPVVQYAAWLAVFSIWMAWFVFFGVRWLYSGREPAEDARR